MLQVMLILLEETRSPEKDERSVELLVGKL